MPFSLIVPIASNRPEYRQQMPFVFQPAEDGISPCVQAIKDLDLRLFDHIYFTILRSLDEIHSLSSLLRKQFQTLGMENVEIVLLDHPTSSQPETIYQTIRQCNITGAVFIKDADCSFAGEIIPHNSVVIYPLESLQWVNPQNKSYVAVDEHFYVTNIIEKRIISHYFLSGGYCFEDAQQYCGYYNRYADEKGLYLSHIIYAMLLDKIPFRPILATQYTDFEMQKI